MNQAPNINAHTNRCLQRSNKTKKHFEIGDLKQIYAQNSRKNDDYKNMRIQNPGRMEKNVNYKP